MKIIEQTVPQIFNSDDNSEEKYVKAKIKQNYLKSKEKEKVALRKLYLYIVYRIRCKLYDIKTLKKLY
ncbi:MAG: hypothetical protein HKP48_08645 [Winogradskyella sp.]|uniref:hypothetical protein n=1 Tax=Winogradskyella sp. TaxID=1883156 RepID=UPI00182142B7|nr:hypothetical protein [Winogradskyella sp.]MBT8245771.1 hypothetical protein [Winogradskyella sp.]NNK23341.1 hypothetical protein [Winogradskyella sp.]